MGRNCNLKFWEDKWVKGDSLREMMAGPLCLGENILTIANVFQEGNWNWEAISSKLPREIKDKMCASPMQLWDDKEDTLKWKFTRDEEFSTASAYALLRPEEANPQIFLGNWIWKLDIWPKIISSLWLCHHDSVPVK